MSAKRPPARPVLVYSRPVSRCAATDAAGAQREDERAALWLYAWSHDALRPTGEPLAARLTSRARVRPGGRVGRLSPRRSRRPSRSAT